MCSSLKHRTYFISVPSGLINACKVQSLPRRNACIAHMCFRIMHTVYRCFLPPETYNSFTDQWITHCRHASHHRRAVLRPKSIRRTSLFASAIRDAYIKVNIRRRNLRTTYWIRNFTRNEEYHSVKYENQNKEGFDRWRCVW